MENFGLWSRGWVGLEAEAGSWLRFPDNWGRDGSRDGSEDEDRGVGESSNISRTGSVTGQGAFGRVWAFISERWLILAQEEQEREG
jgi:hypothetical protein